MIPLTKTCGKFKVFTKAKIGPLVHFSTGRLASFLESRRVHNKRRNLHRGKTLKLCLYFTVTYSAIIAGTYSATFVSSSKNTQLLREGSAETREKYTGGARGSLPGRNTFAIFVLEERKRH